MSRKLFVSHRWKKYFALVLAVLLLSVLCSASFAGSQSCYVCGGDGKVNCHECNGSGRCVFCGGDGKLGYAPGYGVTKGEDIKCNQCNGSGRCSNCKGNRTETCTRCSGSGTIWAPDPDSNNGDGSNKSTTDGTKTTDQTSTNANAVNSPGSSGGGGCNSGFTLLALLATALIIRKSA